MGYTKISRIVNWACKSCSFKLCNPRTPNNKSINSFFSTSTCTNTSTQGMFPRDNTPLWGRHRLLSSSVSVDLDLKSYFNEQDIDRILRTINEVQDLDDLQKFGFSKKKIKVLATKQVVGHQMVESIDDVVAILGATSSLRVFSIILERSNPILRNPMFPVPTTEMVEKASTIVSIVLHGGQISWCCIERNNDKKFILKQLQYQPLEFKKQPFILSLHEVAELCQKIPESHLCIIEEYPTTAAKPPMFPYLLHMTQLRSFLLGNLAARHRSAHVIALKTVAVARLFNTVVGSERVSGQHLVDNMITWKPLPSLIVPISLKHEYENHTEVIKEGLANSILLNLAYWKLTKQFRDSYM